VGAHRVQKCLEEALDHLALRIHPHGHAAEHPHDEEAVAWLAHIHQLVIRAQGDCERCLPIWDHVGRLLQLDNLAVCNLAAVVDQRQCADGCADVARARNRLVDLTAVDFDLDGVVTCEAAEKGDFHTRNDRSCSDD
jgi:hypothetical protein